MIDLDALKEQVNLLALASQETMLKRVAASGGGEWAGACPFCGGKDRFRVQPHHPGGGRWLCRGCSDGKWQDVIAYAQRLWPGLEFRAVCERLAGGAGMIAHSRSQSKAASASIPASPSFPIPSSFNMHAYRAPSADWQSAARNAIGTCVRALWGGAGGAALDYLRRRGLKDETIRYWRLGYSPGFTVSPSPLREMGQGGEGGSPPSAFRGKGTGDGGGRLYLPRGVLIPCITYHASDPAPASGQAGPVRAGLEPEIWYLKLSLLPDDAVKCQDCSAQAAAHQACPKCEAVNKYRGVKGNRTAAIFGAEELRGAALALFVEGEFDAMIAWQELNDVIAVCTLGSAANRPDLATWGPYLLPLERILAVYDADRAGQAGLSALQGLSERVQPVSLPAGAKDINEYVLQGGKLWPWLKARMKSGEDRPDEG
jgi:DNA primase